MNQSISKIIKTGIICSSVTGSCIFLIPNNISIKINQTTFNRIYLPIFGGCLGTFAFIFSPFLIINYFINGTNLDKLYDKYDVNIKRYHQYDGNNNKYAYPSKIIIEINKK
jgi:hypothetical protein